MNCQNISYQDLTKISLEADNILKNTLPDFYISDEVLPESKVHLSTPKDYNTFIKKLFYLNDYEAVKIIVENNLKGIKSSLYCSLCSSIAYNKTSLYLDEFPDPKQLDFYRFFQGDDCYSVGPFYLRHQEEMSYKGHLLINTINHMPSTSFFYDQSILDETIDMVLNNPTLTFINNSTRGSLKIHLHYHASSFNFSMKTENYNLSIDEMNMFEEGVYYLNRFIGRQLYISVKYDPSSDSENLRKFLSQTLYIYNNFNKKSEYYLAGLLFTDNAGLFSITLIVNKNVALEIPNYLYIGNTSTLFYNNLKAEYVKDIDKNADKIIKSYQVPDFYENFTSHIGDSEEYKLDNTNTDIDVAIKNLVRARFKMTEQYRKAATDLLLDKGIKWIEKNKNWVMISDALYRVSFEFLYITYTIPNSYAKCSELFEILNQLASHTYVDEKGIIYGKKGESVKIVTSSIAFPNYKDVENYILCGIQLNNLRKTIPHFKFVYLTVKSRSNKYFILEEKSVEEDTLRNVISTGILYRKFLSIMFQILISLKISQTEYGFIHRNLTSDNVKIIKIKEGVNSWGYVLNSKVYEIDLFGNYIQINGFNKSTIDNEFDDKSSLLDINFLLKDIYSKLIPSMVTVASYPYKKFIEVFLNVKNIDYLIEYTYDEINKNKNLLFVWGEENESGLTRNHHKNEYFHEISLKVENLSENI